MHACVCERERERETLSHIRGLCTANTSELHHCVCHTTLFLFRLELKVKLRTLLNVFTFILKAKARDYGMVTFLTHACGARPIPMLWVSWPIKKDCICQKDGLCKKQSV